MSQYLCTTAEIGENGKEVRVRTGSITHYIMLFRHAGAIRAYFNTCPHQGLPMNCAPGQFLLSRDKLLICAQHGARFELDTGRCLQGPCLGDRLRAVGIRLEKDAVWLEPALN